MASALSHEGAPEQIRMPADVFRRAMDDQVDAERQWILQCRRRERVVAHADRVVCLGDDGQLPEVDDFHQGVRRGLRPEHPGLRSECVLGVDEVSQVDECRFDPVVAHDPREDAIDPSIAVVRHDDVVSFLQEGEGRRDGAHATRERERVLRAL